MGRGVPHLCRPALAARHPVHVTVRFRADVPRLTRGRLYRAVRAPLAASPCPGGMRIVHYAVQRNHAHLLVEAAGREALSRGMRSLNTRIAKAVNRVWRRRGRVLADRYHAVVLTTPRQVRAALAYVLNNHRRHGLGLPDEAIDPCSSGPWFDGWLGLARVPAGHPGSRAGPSPVSRPRTWLLSTGWRRHGPIRVDEVPGGAVRG